ncbi:ribosomal protein [Ordospora pajunii]|jgi:large subunit ribosomal protein L18Ae|uniref:ribosomal protein n=1 Tax=Ordospora pajunii TaxID=3039483 RepID=UPI0029527583|nr:ribosomal protein [Ordospora pajunii]KAH9410998.1 ribosomal protein [Ordospora pajunii]
MDTKSLKPNVFSKVDMTVPITREYRIHGSALPTAADPRPQVYVATIFTSNHVFAKALFFKIIEKKYKIKASKGLIIDCAVVPEPEVKEVQSYGVRFVYRSKKGIHNSYKECRAVSRCAAVDYMLRELSGRNHLKRADVDIISVEMLSKDKLLRGKTIDFSNENVEFPVFSKLLNTKKQLVPADYDPTD